MIDIEKVLTQKDMYLLDNWKNFVPFIIDCLPLQMEDVEALLAGRIPPGRPVETTVVQGGSGDGSKACTVQ